MRRTERIEVQDIRHEPIFIEDFIGRRGKMIHLQWGQAIAGSLVGLVFGVVFGINRVVAAYRAEWGEGGL
jgi:hypothetical protein